MADKQKKDTSLLSGIFAYSGKGDRARKAYIDEQTGDSALPVSSTDEVAGPSTADHKRGYTKEKWD